MKNKESFHCKEEDTPEQVKYKKAKFLLGFDCDPKAQEEGLRLLKELEDSGFRPAHQMLDNLREKEQYKNICKLYKFVYGKDLI